MYVATMLPRAVVLSHVVCTFCDGSSSAKNCADDQDVSDGAMRNSTSNDVQVNRNEYRYAAFDVHMQSLVLPRNQSQSDREDFPVVSVPNQRKQ
jgi:hypothetical protein